MQGTGSGDLDPHAPPPPQRQQTGISSLSLALHTVITYLFCEDLKCHSAQTRGGSYKALLNNLKWKNSCVSVLDQKRIKQLTGDEIQTFFHRRTHLFCQSNSLKYLSSLFMIIMIKSQINHLYKVNNSCSIFQGSTGGAVVRALASHQRGPGSTPGVDAICGLSLLMVFLRVLRFSPLLKNQHLQMPNRSGTHGHV